MKKIIKEVLEEYRSRWNTDSINVKEVITDSELDSITEKLETVIMERGSWIETTDDIQEGLKRAKELSHQALEEGIRKQLAEEIVDNKDEGYIFESPDGGETVYKREFGSDKKVLLTDEQKKQVKQIERELYKGEG